MNDKNMKLSIIIPVFNEEHTIGEILKRVRRTRVRKEIIVVDDGSTDGTGKILSDEKNIILINLKKNMGKTHFSMV
jgi:glycosyltransferase involved in cell wall biosynthesis